MGNVELHFHLLPGIDDGPTSIEQSIDLARLAVADGTDTIVATPHVNPSWNPDVSSLPERVLELADVLRRERIPVKVLCGAELDHEMVAHSSQRELELIAQGPRGRRWLLLEAPLGGLDESFNSSADELRTRGFAVVVAHPERALAVKQCAWPILEHEFAAGSAMQLNAWSVAGLYGDLVRACALVLLARAARVGIASDAHGLARRPSLQLALDALATLGVRQPRGLTEAVPRALLDHGLSAQPVAIAA